MLWLAPEEAPKTQRGYKVKICRGWGSCENPQHCCDPQTDLAPDLKGEGVFPYKVLCCLCPLLSVS